MKITCQSCQSKYTIADDKIQGKVAKIRCRKCGATVVVDGSGGAPADPNAAPASPQEALWTVNVGEGDQRTMSLAEIVDAYHTGVVNGETYLWTDGMGDWLPLQDVPDIVAALSGGGAEAAPAPPPPAPAPAAAVRETGRTRGPDLFGAPADDGVSTSAAAKPAFAAPPPVAAAASSTGARDEQSVLFSLSALTASSPKASPSSPKAASKTSEDSGLIDLNALAKAQAATVGEAAPPPVASPFLFPAALGTVEPVVASTPEPVKKSKTPLLLGVGGGVGVVAIVLAIVLTRKGEPPPAPPPVVAATTASAAPAATTAEPVASAAPAPVDSAAAAASAKAAAGTAKKGAATAGKGGAPAKAGAAAAATPAGVAPPPPPPAKKSGGCGCAPGDLQCMIRCSATGH